MFVYICLYTYIERESIYDKILKLGNVGEEYMELIYIITTLQWVLKYLKIKSYKMGNSLTLMSLISFCLLYTSDAADEVY